jgi:hypothetical protein
MSTDLIPYRSSPLSLRGRQEVAEVREARRPVRRAAVRVQAGAILAHTGLVYVEALTALETEICRRQGASVDERARRIVDGYAGLVVTELNLIPMRGE